MEQPPPQAHPPPSYPESPSPTREERTWAMLSHLLPLAALWLPLGHILVPLVIWLMKREDSAFIGDQANEALNFQISFTMYGLVIGMLGWVTCVGFVLLGALWLTWVFLIILATLRSNAGEAYRYPLTLRLVS